MFGEFFRFELRYWFRGTMVYVFLAIIATLFFAGASSDYVRIGQALGNTHRNAPFVIQMYYAMAGVLTGLMVTAFIDSAASRDFATKSSEIVFSKPISKAAYVFGRFTGASIAALTPTLGVSLGILLAGGIMTWFEPERWGPIDWQAHLNSILIFAIPNTLLFGSVVFAISVWTRSTLYSFLGTLLLLVAYAASEAFLSDFEQEKWAAMLDPLGIAAFANMTKYWTVEEKNTLSVSLSGLMLANRCMWMAVVGGIVGFAYWRFSFAESSRRPRIRKESAAPPLIVAHTVMSVSEHLPNGPQLVWSQLASHLRSDCRGVVRTTVFLVILAAALLNMMPTVWFNATAGYGLSSFPVTYKQVDNIRGSLGGFLVAIITFFAGVLVWRDRDAQSHEILGALPHSNWIAYVSKLLTLVLIVAIVQSLGIAVGAASQWAHGFDRIQLGVYVKELLLIDLARMSFLAVMALLMHTLAPNKYIGYFLFIIFVVCNFFAWMMLRVDTLLVKFGRLPGYTYSDFYDFQPYAPGLFWFGIYWSTFCLLLAWLTIRIAHRGVAVPLFARIRSGFRSVDIAATSFAAIALTVWLSIGGWLYYNTLVLNKLIGEKERERRQVDYEKEYKELEELPQPRVVNVKYEIEIFPETRNVTMRGVQQIVNKSTAPLEKVWFTLAPFHETEIEIEGASLTANDEPKFFRTYTFAEPLKPGGSKSMHFVVRTTTHGIENRLTNTEVVQNGTFFNNQIAPRIGYDVSQELGNPNIRKRYGLPKSEGFPPLSQAPEAAMQQYVAENADWVDVETVISTSSDQIAVAPGSLIEQWEKDGRRYFRYRLDKASLNFYSFISARYTVERDKWHDVDVEIYYLPEHKWNVPKMVQAVRNSLDYCSKNYGPYRHKQARIIEFPRVAAFAQAFPGTMPYSESIGFIANLEHPDDIDFVFYVVSHEMAHQWWAHQVIGAKMQGATLLSETMAQYSALMVMEHQYGRDMMRKFLKYEMDRYLKARGAEQRDERPLLTVNPDQGYIHYNKGSVVMYCLKEMIGEDHVNAALRSVVQRFAYKDPPYPNAHDLMDALAKETPKEYQYLIKDMFYDITLFGNRTTAAEYRPLPDGRFHVILHVECIKFKADPKGMTTEVPIADWIDIGAFAKPEKGKKYGKTLHRQRVFIDKRDSQFEFDVDEIPDQTGVDPFYLLIDRMPEDNLMRPTLMKK